MLIKHLLNGITVKHAFIPQPISLRLNLFGIKISQNLLQIRYGPFTIAVVEHLKDMQLNRIKSRFNSLHNLQSLLFPAANIQLNIESCNFFSIFFSLVAPRPHTPRCFSMALDY